MGLNPVQTDEAYIKVTRHGHRYTVEGLPHCYLSPVRSQAARGVPGTIYAEWTWDGETLTLRTDRLGFYPLFYTQRDGELLASPSVTTLLAWGASAELDEAALATFLRLKFFLGDDTPFKAIRTVPPDGCVRWTGGAPEVRGSLWQPHPLAVSPTAAMDLYADALRAAVRRSLPKDRPWALPLSGGQDSRHLLLTLLELGCRPDSCLTARSYPPTADEHEVAAAVAQAFGMTHHTLEPPPSELGAEVRKNVLTHYGSFEHGWQVAVMDHTASRYRTLYDGIGGDVLSAGLYQDAQRLRLFDEDRLSELADVLLGKEGYLPGLLTSDAYRRFGREVARARVVTELAHHRGAANPVSSFFFWNRTRRGVALGPFALLSRACSVLTPYLDPGVYELLASLPATMVLDHQFHLKTIARAFPQAAAMPYAPTGARQVGDGAAYRRLAGDLLRYSWTGSGRLVRRRFLTARTLRALVDPSYAPAVESFASLAIYLLQLDTLMP